MKRFAKLLIVTLLLAYAAGCAYLYFAQRSFLYHGGNAMPALGSMADVGYRLVDYTAANGQQLTGFYRAPPSDKAYVLLIFHGNAGIDPIVEDHALPLATLPIGIMLATYRGFDGNGGAPTETGLAEDAAAALAYLEGQGIGANRIIIHGQSLGTGVASALAKAMTDGNTPPAGLILEAPFTRMVDMAKHRYWYMPVDWLLEDRFDTMSNIVGLKSPILVMHGEQDQTIPVGMGRELCGAIQAPKTCVYFPEGRHTDLFSYKALDVVRTFIEQLSVQR